jgi:hypothetical protein
MLNSGVLRRVRQILWVGLLFVVAVGYLGALLWWISEPPSVRDAQLQGIQL